MRGLSGGGQQKTAAAYAARGRFDILTAQVMIFYIVGSLLFPNMLSIGYSAYLRFWNTDAIASQRFDSASMADLRALSGTNDVEYIIRVNDGLKLIRAVSSPENKIFVLDFTNPFSFALLRESPRGDMLWWHSELNFNQDIHPPAEKVFGNASIIMLPRHPVHTPTFKSIRRIYGGFIEEHAGILGVSDFWIALLANDVQKKLPGIKFADDDESDAIAKIIYRE